jgi:cell shape-determining protein MreC
MIKAFLAISTVEKLLVVLIWLITLVVLVVIFIDVGKEFSKMIANNKKPSTSNSITLNENNNLNL